MSVANDRAPSYENRPRDRLLTACGLRGRWGGAAVPTWRTGGGGERGAGDDLGEHRRWDGGALRARQATVVIFGLPEGAKFKALAVGDAELHWKMDSWWCRKSASD
jgi:hypothetical protein